MLRILLVFSIFSHSVIADPVLIESGQKAPFSGSLYPTEEAVKLKRRLLDADIYEELTKSYERSINLYKANETIQENKVKVLMEQNDKLAISLRSEREMTGWERFGWFALGVVATSVAVIGLKEALK